MSDKSQLDKSQKKTLKDANAEIARLRMEIAEHDGKEHAREPIAIVGMGCRFPGGVRTPDDFWNLLKSGRDVLRDIPNDRWDIDEHYDPEVPVPGKIYVQKGYYLDDIDQFDPQFFGLSPREAESLDPQQRLVMEVAWETLEHAGIAPTSLKGEKTGVFIGQYWDDYSSQRIYSTDNREIDRYAQLSALRGLTAGRICHVLDSHGPAIQLDTACSSSSLAVHLACQSLRNGESDLALAGGVSLILAPEHLIGICQMTALSPDGRCKTFDANADGFGQGEGCGIVALKRLCDAQADGDHVLAVVQGSAANHDGQARTVTTPSGPAQRAMLRDALANAGIEPHQVDFIETHGTGTPLGDPIEVSAIGRVFCEDRDKALYIGAVKANVGHLDSAAGIAGLIKVVLAVKHKTIPLHINFTEANRHIPWDDWPIKIPLENTEWGGNERFAGISAFGMSGTNVHLIVGQAPKPMIADEAHLLVPKNEQLLVLSARAEGALTEIAKRYANLLEANDSAGEPFLHSLCYSAATGRSHFSHRAAFTASDPLELTHALKKFADGGFTHRTKTGGTGRRAPKLAFLFTGQGAQHVGMGRELYGQQPIFRATLDKCNELFEDHLEHSLLDVMWTSDVLHQTAYTQPSLFAIEYSLAKLFESWGIVPDLLLGHSIGEYVAACVAGVFTLEEAVRLVSARGRLMQSLPIGGKMVSAVLDEEATQREIKEFSSVSVAAVNAAQSIVLAGEGKEIDEVVSRLERRGVKTTPLNVSHAFHSPLMDPILEEFRTITESVNFNPPTMTLISNHTGKPWDGSQLSPKYWVDHLRGTVRFADGINYAKSKKFQTFVEIGPKPILLGLGRSSFPPDTGSWIPSLRPDFEWSTILACLEKLYTGGCDIHWKNFYANSRLQRMELPNYPWRYQRCWTEMISTSGGGKRLHPLVHRKIENASKSGIFESILSADSPAYLNDHRVFGAVVFPASAFFEMAMVVANLMFGQNEVALTNVSIGRALKLSDEPVKVQIIATPNGDRFEFEVYSRLVKDAEGEWIQHTTGTLERRLPSPAAITNIDDELKNFVDQINVDELSARFEARGLEYFPRFRAIEAIFMAGDVSNNEFGSAIAHIKLPDGAVLSGDSYRLHPVITDASFRIAEAIFKEEKDDLIHLPFGISGFSCDHAATESVWVKVSARQKAQTRVVDLQIYDESGARVATVEQLTLRSVAVSKLKDSMDRPKVTSDILSDWLYHLDWEEADLAGSSVESGNWLLLADNGDLVKSLISTMKMKGHSVHVASSADIAVEFLSSEKAHGLIGILHLWGTDVSEDNPDVPLLESLKVVQSLIKNNGSGKHWFVTKGAQAVVSTDAVSPWQSQFWGFGRALQIENPAAFGGCVDLDPNIDETLSCLAMLVNELSSNDGETEVAFRRETRHVGRLSKPVYNEESKLSLELDPAASYLITGGIGALGLHVAQYLATHGARHLVLTGRSGVSTEDQRAVIKAIGDVGVKVDIISTDIGNEEHVKDLLKSIPRLRGVVHAAGVLSDGMLMQQTVKSFRKVAGPKVRGAWYLHSNTQDQSLDFFVLFSSVASILGSPGQSNYAASNAFMDGLAHFRKRKGLVATAINWGPWADVGMAASKVVVQRLKKDGWQPMNASQGCDFIGHLLMRYDLPQAAILPVDWEQFATNIPGAEQWSTLKRCVPKGQPIPLVGNSAELAAQSVKDASPDQRIDLASSYLLERVAQTLRVPAADLDEFAKLGDLGVDSLTAVEIQIWVRGDLGVEFTPEQLFTAPSIRHLAILIDQSLGGDHGDVEKVGAPSLSNQPSWIICPHPRSDAKLRLYCFPYAGGGASAFYSWGKVLPENVEVCVIQMPGREERLGETLIKDMSKLANAVANEVIKSSKHPFAFFGHSMGAIVAYETARQLSSMGTLQPVHLFLSARAAPHLQENSDALRFLDDESFLDRLQKTYGAVPEVIRQSVELRQIFLPILRADVELLETYEESSSAPLNCPITALGGIHDPAISKEKLEGWKTRTKSEFRQYDFPGKHFFIDEERQSVVAAIATDLAHSL